MGSLAVSYFHTANAALSSALRRFTVLFGMGRGGSGGLWSSGIEGDRARALRAGAGSTEEAKGWGDCGHKHREAAAPTVMGSSRTGN